MVEPWRKEEEKKNRDGRIDWVWKGKGEKEKESAISRVVLENIGEIVDYDKVGEGSQQVNIREESEKILLFFQILDFDSFQSIEFWGKIGPVSGIAAAAAAASVSVSAIVVNFGRVFFGKGNHQIIGRVIAVVGACENRALEKRILQGQTDSVLEYERWDSAIFKMTSDFQ